MEREELMTFFSTLDPTPYGLALAEGLLLGYLSKEGYGDVVRAYLGLRQRLLDARQGEERGTLAYAKTSQYCL